jgi:nitrogen-specific signal transduction histidine kinase
MYVQVVDALPDAVLVVADQRVAWANRAAADLLGAEPGSLSGAPMQELVWERDLERIGRRLQLGNRSVFRLALQRWADGASVMTDARVVARTSADAVTYLLTAREVEQHQGLEGLLARLGESLLGGSGGQEVDLPGVVEALGPVFRARRWSGSLWSVSSDSARLEHVVAGELLGRAALDFTHSLQGTWIPFDELPILAQVARTQRGAFMDDAERLAGDVSRRRGGGEAHAEAVERSLSEQRLSRGAWAPVLGPRGVEYVLTVFGADMNSADFVAVLLVAHHISACLALGRLNAELLGKERAAALGEMSALVAHEMRMPVSILYNTVGELDRSLDDAQRREALLRVMREESAQLVHLVDNLMHFARPLAAQREPVPLDQLVTRALARARNARNDADCTARVRIDVPSPAPVVLADPVLLSHALANLLSNAFDHVAENGEIRVAVDRAAHGDVRIRVFNDGPSVPPSDAERIFDPFVTQRPGSAGLGLAVVRRVVEALDGQVQMDRAPSGTSFSIWLPAAVQRARVSAMR